MQFRRAFRQRRREEVDNPFATVVAEPESKCRMTFMSLLCQLCQFSLQFLLNFPQSFPQPPSTSFSFRRDSFHGNSAAFHDFNEIFHGSAKNTFPFSLFHGFSDCTTAKLRDLLGLRIDFLIEWSLGMANESNEN
jgi:hypothetical protein